MNAYFAKDVADFRHAELMARAEQSRRYHTARAARTGHSTRPTPRTGSAGPLSAVRRPFSAVHAWLVAGVL